MVERLHIDAIGHRGDAVAHRSEGPVYVPYALPGEDVDADAVQGHPDRRHLIRVVTPSAERIAPFCPHFGLCGGCAIQHWAAEPYAQWKRGLVVSALAQAGLDAPVDTLIDAHGEGRRRMVLHARRGTKDIVEVGFSALRAHVIVPIDRCPVLAPSLAHAIEAAWAIAEALAPWDKPLDIHATGTLNGLDIDVRGSGPLKTRQLTALAKVASQFRIARITRHGEFVTQVAQPVVRMGKAQVTLPPGPFLQATEQGEQVLAEQVLALTGKAKTIADLFCGLGPFALRLAEKARVFAFDSDQKAVDALTSAAKATPGLKPLTATRRDLFRYPVTTQELASFDAIVFDPPRQGAEAQAREIARSSCRNVIAVSCNPATFVRDARILVDGGYALRGVTPVDQFKHTAHVEMVGHFTR
jgi:23S rRNA (uracil1939-C5)-methyltransferase